MILIHGQYQTIIANYGKSSGGGLGINNGGGLTGEYAINGTYKTIMEKYLDINKTYLLSLTYDGNVEKLYINKESNISKDIQVNGTITSPSYNMILGKAPIEEHCFRGKVYSVRVYNRALSADEIHHNYLIDKARFGIEE